MTGSRPRGADLQVHAQGLHTLVVGADQREQAAKLHVWVCIPVTYPGFGLSPSTLDLVACQVHVYHRLGCCQVYVPLDLVIYQVHMPSSKPACNESSVCTHLFWVGTGPKVDGFINKAKFKRGGYRCRTQVFFGAAPRPNSFGSEAGFTSLNHALVFYRPKNPWFVAPHT